MLCRKRNVTEPGQEASQIVPPKSLEQEFAVSNATRYAVAIDQPCKRRVGGLSAPECESCPLQADTRRLRTPRAEFVEGFSFELP